MSIRHAIFSLPLIIVTTAAAFAGDAVALARQAISEDDAASRAAVAELREMGQPGLDALLAVYADEVAKYARDGDGSDEWRRIASAIDTVAMQKDAYASGLYWYTDLDDSSAANNGDWDGAVAQANATTAYPSRTVRSRTRSVVT